MQTILPHTPVTAGTTPAPALTIQAAPAAPRVEIVNPRPAGQPFSVLVKAPVNDDDLCVYRAAL